MIYSIVNFTKQPVSKRLAYAKNILYQLTKNPNFPDPTPSLLTLQKELDALEVEEKKILSLKTEISVAYARRNQHYANTQSMLNSLCRYVNYVANGKLELLQTAGFDTREATGGRAFQPAVPLGQVSGFKVERGTIDGELIFDWDALPHASAYLVQSSKNEHAEQWKNLHLGAEVGARVVMDIGVDEDGLKLAERTFFRVLGIGKAGDGPWSKVVSIYVI